jgi:hypothetical protein
VGLYYNFDQYLYTEQDDPTQGVGLFGVGWAREDVTAQLLLQHRRGRQGGPLGRDQDTLGRLILRRSQYDLPSVLHKETGVEMYTTSKSPLGDLTPDIQVIADQADDHERLLVCLGACACC